MTPEFDRFLSGLEQKIDDINLFESIRSGLATVESLDDDSGDDDVRRIANDVIKATEIPIRVSDSDVEDLEFEGKTHGFAMVAPPKPVLDRCGDDSIYFEFSFSVSSNSEYSSGTDVPYGSTSVEYEPAGEYTTYDISAELEKITYIDKTGDLAELSQEQFMSMASMSEEQYDDMVAQMAEKVENKANSDADYYC